MRHKPCYLFIVLSNKCLWTNFHFRYICVLVQHMDVIVWWDAVDALAFQRCSTLFAAHDLANLNISFKNRIMIVYYWISPRFVTRQLLELCGITFILP